MTDSKQAVPTFDAAEILTGEGDFIRYGNVTVRFELVTPDTAQHWLATYNTQNRNIRETRVAGHARDMIAENWPITGDAIRFADVVESTVDVNQPERVLTKVLIDGQHRLAAIVRADIAQVCLIVEGLGVEVQEVIDTNALRSLADDLAFKKIPNSPVTAAIIRRVAIFKAGSLPHTGGQRSTPTKTELRAFYNENTQAISAAVRIAMKVQNSTPKLEIPGSALATAYYLCAEKDQTGADIFFGEQVIESRNIDTNDPASRLRYKIGRAKLDRLTTNELFLYSLKSWNHFRNGEKIQKLQAPRDGWPTSMKDFRIV